MGIGRRHQRVRCAERGCNRRPAGANGVHRELKRAPRFVVTGRVVASMQTKRLNATAKYAPDVISFHESVKEAYADVRRFLDTQ